MSSIASSPAQRDAFRPSVSSGARSFDATSRPVPSEQHYAVRFDGSGGEYFRIWIVNLLLTLVTFGLYYPFAKVRKLRYFYASTSVAGHGFDFHGNPWRMLRGYPLVGALFALYSFAGNVSPAAGLIAFLAIAALWPALLRASLRFRLANTSWRGLRLRFTGTMGGAYKAVLWLFAPGALLIGAVAFDQPQAAGAAPSLAATLLPLVVMLATLALMPVFLWALKRYQHDNYQLASVRTRLAAGVGAFYGLFLRALGVLWLTGAVAGVLVGVLAIAMALTGQAGSGMAVVLTAAGAIVGYALTIIVLYPYFTSRMQNLVWSRTESRSLRFHSELRFRPLLVLTLKNWLLVLLTLGLYWPFAAIATARMRLEAVSVVARTDLEALVARSREREDDAAGDAAGDLFGIDVGL